MASTRSGSVRPERNRGGPVKDEAVEPELVYRLRLNTTALNPPGETFGGRVLATTVSAPTCDEAEIVQAYRDQTTTGAPGLRWMQNPAAILPVWWATRECIAAFARLTVVGLLVYSVIQRQVRPSWQQRHESMPGNQGETATPTAPVVGESCAPVTVVYLDLAGTVVPQMHGWQAHHQLICEALEVSDMWYAGAADRKNNSTRRRAP